jgi:hypothetical protein
LKSEAGVNNGLIFLLYAQPPVWRACPTLDKIVAAHDLSMFVGQYHERHMSLFSTSV